MAKQDFAHVTAQVELLKPEDVRPVSSTKMMLLTIAGLVVLAVSFAGGYKFGHKAGEESAQSESKARLVAQVEAQQQELEHLRKEAAARVPEASTTQVGELTFYNELPKQPVEPAPLGEAEPPEAAAVEAPAESSPSSEELLQQIIENELKQGERQSTTSASLSGHFYVQAASFLKEEDATAFAAKLKAAAMPAMVRQVVLERLGVRYRVFAGPYETHAKADAAKMELKSKMNITGLVVRRDG